MRIGLISDTHGSLKAWNQAMELFQDCQVILHGGDILYHGPRNPLPEGYDPKELANELNNLGKSLFMVGGNCDAEVDNMVLNHPVLTPYFYTSLEGLNILVLHGHKYSQEELFQLGKRYQADMIMVGHTHIPQIKHQDDLILINPGSPSLPKGEDKVPAVGILDTTEKTVEIKDLRNTNTLISSSW
ncbi:phosphodiesterase [Natranaerobius thermophilus]|uniref:Phosphoesterase n=1 Tax=Natranaerobius thermophilus (strain ATCC BAA-1301 / DSM 18059 / JW/NM-WN-LF) TaxID=457570 RepID=B2A6V5_NATTJ|nr:phosphodiesterase [Natranaerobius thermophilus]ACB84236.1 phosphodiesterase, MJ0936 family [Natranaerobius thermophilus JW/NM-WN-LF]